MKIINLFFAFFCLFSRANIILEAEKSIKENVDLSAFSHLEPHPNYPDLEYQYYLKNLHKTQEISAFLKKYPNLAGSALLAEKAYQFWYPQNSQLILDTYNVAFANDEINCWYAKSAKILGKSYSEALSLSINCAELFTPQQLRQKFWQLMSENKKSLASKLLPYFSSQEALFAQQILNEENPLFIENDYWRSASAALKINQLSKKNLEEALSLAQLYDLKDTEHFKHAYNRLISNLAKKDYPQSLALWHKMPQGSPSESAYFDTLAYILRNGFWSEINKISAKLSPEMLAEAEVQYWLAKAAEKNSRFEKAKRHYQNAAEKRDYFGFLAADVLHQNYNFNHKKIINNQKLKAKLNSGIYRIIFWNNLSDKQRANREFQSFIRERSDEEIAEIATLLSQKNLNLYAISALAKYKLWDYLELRFPIKYKPEIEKLSQKHNLKSSQILAIIRKESIFQENAKSPVGALGLMQVMPKTALETAKKYQIEYNGNINQLLIPEINLQIGTQYLSDRLQEFGHLAYAAAAYNAGPARVRAWLERKIPIDEWIAQIPFAETRDYVKKVLEYEKIYEYLLQNN